MKPTNEVHNSTAMLNGKRRTFFLNVFASYQSNGREVRRRRARPLTCAILAARFHRRFMLDARDGRQGA